MEASRSLGLNYWQSMRYVIVPQAVKNILPALANEFISLIKESAIVSVVGITDLTFFASSVKNSTGNFFGPYLFAAVVYFVITFTLSKLVGLLERSEEHTSELQSRQYLVCRLLLEKKKRL